MFLLTWLFGALLGCQPGCQSEARPSAQALTVLLPREPLELDPRFAADVYSLKVSRLLFASLVTIDPQTLTPVPQLAAHIETETPTSYGVALKPGLRFSDGSALDSEDVAATFRGLVDPALGSRYASTYRRIARIEVIDKLHLRFHLTAPHATFLTDLEMPVLRAEDALHPVGRNGVPVVSGPYRLRSRTHRELHLVPNPHFAKQPRFPRLVLRVVRDDNIRALRMLTGSGDLAVNAVPPLLLPLFTERETFSVRRAMGVGTTYIGVNLEAEALGDGRVRRAIAHAIDRPRIVRTKLGGRARLARSFIPPGHWAYSDTTPSYAYAPERSKRLLREAKFGDGLSLVLRCSSDREVLSMARVLAAMLGDVGIEVKIRPSELSTLLADLNQGRFELTFLQMPELIEPHVLSWFFASNHIPGPAREGANRWRFRSVALDAALEDGRSHTAIEARRSAYRVAQRVLAQQLPIIPLWHEDQVAVLNGQARGYLISRHGRFDGLFKD